ncbi:MAG: hypothetical protein ACI8XM_002846 [Haloarculaceae archaeon]|jgi:hypothetical protein
MNGQMLVEQIRERKGTELERLSSDKALLAATRADLTAETILETVTLQVDGLQTTLAPWAEETDGGEAATAFAETAESLDGEYDRVLANLDADPAGEPPVPIPTVGSFDQPVERVAAGFVGHGLVFDGVLLQAVSFFVNEADERRADLVRDLRSSANSRVDEGAVLLDSLCAEDDWDRAEEAATDVVEAAYRDYAETLGELGIDPKPVC